MTGVAPTAMSIVWSSRVALSMLATTPPTNTVGSRPSLRAVSLPATVTIGAAAPPPEISSSRSSRVSWARKPVLPGAVAPARTAAWIEAASSAGVLSAPLSATGTSEVLTLIGRISPAVMVERSSPASGAPSNAVVWPPPAAPVIARCVTSTRAEPSFTLAATNWPLLMSRTRPSKASIGSIAPLSFLRPSETSYSPVAGSPVSMVRSIAAHRPFAQTPSDLAVK